MTKTTLGKLGLFAALYLSIGIPHGFFQKTAPFVLRENGFSLERIGALTFLFALPWMMKFVWAPIVDRIFLPRLGRRRSWILPLHVLAAAVFLILACSNLSDMGFFIALVFALNMVGATQDAVTDGYGVDLLKPQERGWGNGIQIGGYWLGFTVGGGLLLILQPLLGWRTVYTLLAIIVLLAMVPALLRAEPPPRTRRQRMGLRAFLRRPGMLRVFAIIVFTRCGIGFLSSLHVPYLHDRGFDLAQIGWMTGVLGPIFALVGALIAGALANRLGRRRGLLGAMALNVPTALALFALARATDPGPWITTLVIGCEHLVTSMVMVALFAFMMDWCLTDQSAAEYTLMDSAGIAAAMCFAVVAHLLAESFGYSGHYLIATGTYVVLFAIVFVLFSRAFENTHRIPVEQTQHG